MFCAVLLSRSLELFSSDGKYSTACLFQNTYQGHLVSSYIICVIGEFINIGILSSIIYSYLYKEGKTHPVLVQDENHYYFTYNTCKYPRVGIVVNIKGIYLYAW